MKVALLALVLVSGVARADYMSIICDRAVTEESGADDAKYAFGKADKWGQSVDGVDVRLKNVTDWKKGDDVKGLIATEVTKKHGYRQFFYDCKGSCWSAETAKLTVYEVGAGNGREKIDGPVKCIVSVD